MIYFNKKKDVQFFPELIQNAKKGKTKYIIGSVDILVTWMKKLFWVGLINGLGE